MRIPFEVWTVDRQHLAVCQTFITQPNAICLASVTRLHQTFTLFSHAAFAFKCKPGFSLAIFIFLRYPFGKSSQTVDSQGCRVIVSMVQSDHLLVHIKKYLSSLGCTRAKFGYHKWLRRQKLVFFPDLK